MTGEAGQATPARRLELVTDPADGLGAALVAGVRAREVDGDLRASRQSFELAYQLAERAGVSWRRPRARRRRWACPSPTRVPAGQRTWSRNATGPAGSGVWPGETGAS
ncbi:MAG TPA: hypothetical protein VGS06_28055 [Streptosporangiaceae bacterium]|nr:hypothetical protein [Streptosporangiaceae bacterium]